MIRYNMIWHDIIRYDMIWYNMIWYDVTQLDGILYNIKFYIINNSLQYNELNYDIVLFYTVA